MTPLAELFPETDHRFRLTLRRGDPRAFFQSWDDSGKLLAERRRWLAAAPTRHAQVQPEGAHVLSEFAELAATWGAAQTDGSPLESMSDLGGALEPDILLLAPDTAGAFRLRAGALCFPTGWALEEKIGGTLEAIHGVVPGLNPALGSPIHQFLTKLKPGIAFHRDNWGLAATDELNLHPARSLPPPALPVDLRRLWLRIEHQALVALPRTRGVLFGIRIRLHRMDEIAASPDVRRGFVRELATLPDALAAYKRLDVIRSALLAELS